MMSKLWYFWFLFSTRPRQSMLWR